MIIIERIILDFISHFHGSEEVFLYGCCYWFAMILKIRFKTIYNVDIYYEPVEGHFVTKIVDKYYDIRGNVSDQYKDKQMYKMEDLWDDDYKYYMKLMRDCRDFIEVDQA